MQQVDDGSTQAAAVKAEWLSVAEGLMFIREP